MLMSPMMMFVSAVATACMVVSMAAAAPDQCTFGQLKCMPEGQQAFEACKKVVNGTTWDNVPRDCNRCGSSSDGAGVVCDAFGVASGATPDQEVWFPGVRTVNPNTGAFEGHGRYSKQPNDSANGNWVWEGRSEGSSSPFAVVEMPPLNGGMYISVAHCFQVEALALDSDGNTFRGQANGQQYVYANPSPPDDPKKHHRFKFTSEEWLNLSLYRFVVTTIC